MPNQPPIIMRQPTFYYPDVPDLPLPDGHRFPAEKYRMLGELTETSGLLGQAELVPSPAATREELLYAHDADYIDAVFTGNLDAKIQRRIGLPWSPTLLARSRATVGGSLAAAKNALKLGVSGQLAGGTHHAHRDFGSGFCTFNDLAVTTLILLDEGYCERIVILDLDVHQGDGNAAILASTPNALVISIHGEKNFPFRKVPSDIDIGLPDNTDDVAYLQAVETALEAVQTFAPDLLLYLSGADALEADRLGRLSLSLEGLYRRDERVFQFAREQSLPVSFSIGGGYSDPITETVSGYAGTLRSARDVFRF